MRRSTPPLCILSIFAATLAGGGCELPSDDYGVSEHAVSAWSHQVTLKRLRTGYFWPFKKGTLHAPFGEWNTYDVGRDHQSRTYVAEMYPGRDAVEEILLIAAGQQGTELFGGQSSNVLTGQDDDYKGPFRDDNNLHARAQDIHPQSLFDRLMAEGIYDPSTTYVMVVFDASFYHELSAGEKDDIEDAFYHHIFGRVDTSRLRSVTMAGQSRGGCLVTRLAARWNQSGDPHAPAIVVGGDPVCRVSQNEGGTYSTNARIYNPVNSDYFGYKSRMSQLFPTPGAVSYFSVHGGEGVAIDLLLVHTFVDELSYEVENVRMHEASDWYWLHQSWIDCQHEDCGRDYGLSEHTVDRYLEHIITSRMHYDCGAERWDPWAGRCTGAPFAPRAVTASASGQDLSLTWSDRSDSATTHFELWQMWDQGKPFKVREVAVNGVAQYAVSLTGNPSGSHRFFVRAVTADGRRSNFGVSNPIEL